MKMGEVLSCLFSEIRSGRGAEVFEQAALQCTRRRDAVTHILGSPGYTMSMKLSSYEYQLCR